MIEIPLTQGKVALVDDVDADLAEHTWTYKKGKKNGGYAVRKVCGKTLHLHDVIAERKGIVGMMLHRDHDKLNCTRKNILPATTKADDVRHRRKFARNKLGPKGVSKFRTDQCQAAIGYERKVYGLGVWLRTETGILHGAFAYTVAATALFGATVAEFEDVSHLLSEIDKRAITADVLGRLKRHGLIE